MRTYLQVPLSHRVPGADIVGLGAKADNVSSHHHHGQGKVRARLARLWIHRGTEHWWLVNTVEGARCSVKRIKLVLSGTLG